MEFQAIRAAHIRFGYSAGRETLRAISVLAAPARHVEQHEWLRLARPRLTREIRAGIRHFSFLLKPRPEVFPALWPADGATDFETDLRQYYGGLRAYTDAVLVRLAGDRLVGPERLAELRRPAWYRRAARDHARTSPSSAAILEEFATSPERSHDRFGTFLRVFYDDIMKPLVGPIHELLARDIDARATMIRTHGFISALRTLAKNIVVTRTRDGQCNLRFGQGQDAIALSEGSTLALTPSYFTWPNVQMFALRHPKGPRCSIVYPLPTLPDRVERLQARRVELVLLSALADQSRLRIVELLAHRELSTRELAGFLDTSEPVISRHLRILHEAGVLVSRRSGYFVLYGLQRGALRHLAETLQAL